MSNKQDDEPRDARGFDFDSEDLSPPPGHRSAAGGAPEGGYSERDNLLANEVGGADKDLAAMYVKPAKSEHSITFKDGLPPAEPKSRRGVFIAIFILFIIGGIAGVLFGIQMELITPEGLKTKVPTYKWISAQFTMDPRTRNLQFADDKKRGYLITVDRIERVYNAALEYYQKKGELPTELGQLIDSKLVALVDTDDGWSHGFLLWEKSGELEVRSMGPDAAPRTSDDLVYYKQKLEIPPEFEAMTLQTELGGK